MKKTSEQFLRQQIRRELRRQQRLDELFELGDLQGYVNDLGELGKVLWNDFKFVLSGLKILQAIFSIRDSTAAKILNDWDRETSQLAQDNQRLADALNKSQASLDLFAIAPTVAMGRMLSANVLQIANDRVSFSDSLATTVKGPIGKRRIGNDDNSLTTRLRRLFFLTDSFNRSMPLINEATIVNFTREQVSDFLKREVPEFADIRREYKDKITRVNNDIKDVLNNSITKFKEIFQKDDIEEILRILGGIDPSIESEIRSAYDEVQEEILTDPDLKDDAGKDFDATTAKFKADEIFLQVIYANLGEGIERLKGELENLKNTLANKGLTGEVLEQSDIVEAKELAETFVKIEQIFEEIENLKP
jgi:hypothetical protein